MSSPLKNLTVAIGPAMPGIGSWDWVGIDSITALSDHFRVTTWSEKIPECDVAIIVKYGFSADAIASAKTPLLIYMPIDRYGSSADIDSHGRLLAQCARIVCHSNTLVHYFRSYAPVDYLDHAIRYVPPLEERRSRADDILYIGMRSSISPLVSWVNSNSLAGPLLVLTNLEDGERAAPRQLGFKPHVDVRIERWTVQRHLEAAASAALAIDIKGNDFRQRHKPPAKALDFLAAGLPLAMNLASSGARHLAEIGFQIANPRDVSKWTSPEYRRETEQFGAFLRENLSIERIGERLREIVTDVLSGSSRSAIRVPNGMQTPTTSAGESFAAEPSSSKARIAILSFLFNWPSTGGGIIHTVELAKFLRLAGYEVEVVSPRFNPWGIGQIDESCPIDVTLLTFEAADWNAASIRARFCEAVGRINPDHVVITDSWNFKPHLAKAVAGYSYFLRMQAQELLCPLNNLRLLPAADGPPTQCPADQLSQPETCFNCLIKQGHISGELHKAERKLSGFGCDEYTLMLSESIKNATAVLTLNPEVAERFAEHADRVEVVTWGMDPARFLRPRESRTRGDGPVRILFAGVASEAIKGFDVLHEACRRLRESRDDFELVVTHDPPGKIDGFTTSVGWKTQAELPSVYADCDMVAVPTIAQDGLSRTSVEAMATGVPVIASRLGGIPYSVKDGVTGLLCNPGDPADWCRKLERLIENNGLRAELGQAGRRAFEDRFTWEGVIERDYDRLFLEQSAMREAP